VALICHSMGGLIARLAVLDEGPGLDFLDWLFLLGTPNRGAFRTSQLSPLFQGMLGSGVVKALFNRAPGILDLTRTLSIFKLFEKLEPRAEGVNYVTVAGCFFHPEQPVSRMYQAAERLFVLLHFAAPLRRPHDGVVERASNCLAPVEVGSWNEKADSINHRWQKDPTYVHVDHRVCETLTHGEIQSCPEVISLVWELLNATSLQHWIDDLAEKHDHSIKPVVH